MGFANYNNNNKKKKGSTTTVNGERFAGLNIRVFHGFQEYRKNFSMNRVGAWWYYGTVPIMGLLGYNWHIYQKQSQTTIHI